MCAAPRANVFCISQTTNPKPENMFLMYIYIYIDAVFSALSPAQCWSLQLPRPRDLFVFVSNETLQEPGNLHTGNVCCLFGVPTPQAIHPLIHMYISFSIHMYLYMIIYIYRDVYRYIRIQCSQNKEKHTGRVDNIFGFIIRCCTARSFKSLN